MRFRVPALAFAVALSVASFTPAAIAQSGSGPRPTKPPPEFSTAAATCWFGACYQYVSGRQDVRGTGASVDLFQARPALDPKDRASSHSLHELAVMSADRAFIVEVGWTVDPNLNGDNKPHLFVYHWVNNTESCYNGCGFVRVSSPNQPGMTVSTGATGSYAIQFSGGKWWIAYNGSRFGYFPGSLWGNRYTRYEVVQVFGEVSSTGMQSCNDMGNGKLGSRSGSSSISSYAIQGASTAPSLTVSATTPNLYDQGAVTKTGFRLGGPGTGSC